MKSSRGVALVAALTVASLLPAVTAQADADGFARPATGFSSTSTASRITFSWERAITTEGRRRVDYTVTIAGNSKLARDSNFQVKSFRGYSKTSTRSVRDGSTFAVKVPQTYGYGPRIWVRVDAKVVGSKATRARSRTFTAGLVPADPRASGDLRVTPSCKGFTARWAAGRTPARARGMAVRVARKQPDGSFDAWKSSVGHEPASSLALSSLASATTYRVQARATSVGERSTWTDPVEVTTSTCQPGVIRVGTYNTQVYWANKVSWPKYRAARVASQIKGAKLDLVATQELPGSKGRQASVLMDRLGAPWRDATNTITGTHFLYNSRRLVRTGPQRHYPAQGASTVMVQGFSTTTTRDEDVVNYTPPLTFEAVDIHVPEGLTQAERRKEVKAALDIVDYIKDKRSTPDLPVIVLGDVYLATSEEKRTAVRQLLSATMSDTEFFEPGRTLDPYGSRNGLVRCPPRGTGVKVDGIFVSDTVAVTAWSMPKYKFSRGCFRHGFASDHNLVTASVWLPPDIPRGP